MNALCSHCKKRKVKKALFPFNQTSLCGFCIKWYRENPIPFVVGPNYDKKKEQEKWEKADAEETLREQGLNSNWKPPEGVVLESAENKGEEDRSMRTGLTVMVFGAFFGLLAGGLGGAVLGAALGFAGTAVVMMVQEASSGH